jgi:glycosyltransferase involved in cell wall biosynthesis
LVKQLLVVTPTYWPEGSGGTLATHLIVKLLSQTGRFSITVLTGTWSPEYVPGVRYVIDPLLKFIEKSFSLPRLVKSRYGKLIEKYDVIYIVYAYSFIPVAKKLGKKVVVHLHDYRPASPSSVILSEQAENLSISRLIIESFRVKWLERKSINPVLLNIGDSARTPLIARWVSEADVVITVSKRHAELLGKAIPQIRSSVRVVYNPLPPMPQIRKEPADTPIFLYLGGESYIKGFHILMQAIRRFLMEGYKAQFIFAGKYTPKTLASLEKINKRYENCIYVIGRVSHEKVITLYQRAWALIFPSICEEPLPYVILEALQTLTIPAATAVGGILELIVLDGLKTFLFRSNDAQALYKKLLDISTLSKKQLSEIISLINENNEFLFNNISTALESFIDTVS